MIKEIRERLEKASKGNWHVINQKRKFRSFDVLDGKQDRDDYESPIACRMTEGDAELFAHAPTDIAFLLQEVERLEKKSIKLEKQVLRLKRELREYEEEPTI